MPDLTLVSDFQPTGDRPQAIDKLVEGLEAGHRYQTLLSVTGSGRLFSSATSVRQPPLRTAPAGDG